MGDRTGRGEKGGAPRVAVVGEANRPQADGGHQDRGEQAGQRSPGPEAATRDQPVGGQDPAFRPSPGPSPGRLWAWTLPWPWRG
jgi:hypothetical protein